MRQRHRGTPALGGDDFHERLGGLQQGVAGPHAEATVGDGQRVPEDGVRQLTPQRFLRGRGSPGDHEQQAGGDQQLQVDADEVEAKKFAEFCIRSSPKKLYDGFVFVCFVCLFFVFFSKRNANVSYDA